MATRAPITCHVLDTVSGRPASAVPVTLTLHSPSSILSEPFTATTDKDGRITTWTGPDGLSSLPTAFEKAKEEGEKVLVWGLKFDVGAYFEGQGFWTEVEVKFKTEVEEGGREHWHVPLLLSPWSYTTYRGS